MLLSVATTAQSGGGLLLSNSHADPALATVAAPMRASAHRALSTPSIHCYVRISAIYLHQSLATTTTTITTALANMLFRALLAATAFTGLVSAQNATSTYTVDPNSVAATERATWCANQRTNCYSICGGQAYPNTCDDTTLAWTCTCTDGSKPNISDYQNTIPSLECNAWFSQCIAENTQDLAAQDQCKLVHCGTKAPNPDTSSTSDSSSATSTASGTGTTGSSTTSTAASGSGTAAASSTHGSDATVIGSQYGTGILASAFLALFGLAL
ncbi:Hypothetical protein R9X50_00397600 [Acrodontium crateriforme]|uniref:DUF7707 domain-containing protein n=1 Tax=Acrodontium crateriforme TaxID=150365 RepID=A0AAQ3R9V3_9PEZI|nr:Hypothetical protein R9X50_00397600 [Acrodontium crateriforme]